MAKKIRPRIIANDEQILEKWHAGSAAGCIGLFDLDEAFGQVGNSLILNIEGWHYEKYTVPGTKYYVVLAWDDSGNQIVE